ncbi:MAG: hypothetical protein KJ072_24360 [Verrucomicrobia bacterium]|nr:hypothetical protein [Verrucomicrobiota bacterium]
MSGATSRFLHAGSCGLGLQLLDGVSLVRALARRKEKRGSETLPECRPRPSHQTLVRSNEVLVAPGMGESLSHHWMAADHWPAGYGLRWQPKGDPLGWDGGGRCFGERSSFTTHPLPTGTGWIVSVLGLKVSVGFYALPLVGLGALLKLLAHVSFNLATGCIAVVLLPLFLWAIGLAQRHAGLEAGAMSLAAFHTLFIAVGVAIFLPFVHRFSRAIERLLPDRGPALTRHLDDTVLQTPAVALEATRRALRETAAETFRALRGGLGGPADDAAPSEEQLRPVLDRLREFFPRIPPAAEDEPLSQSRVAQMHAMDHLTRLQARLTPPANVRRALDEAGMETALKLARAILAQGEAGLRGGAPEGWLPQVEQYATSLVELRRRQRPEILQDTAGGASAPGRALDLLDAMRWLDRLGYHTWRICHYLGPEDHSARSLTDASDRSDE